MKKMGRTLGALFAVLLTLTLLAPAAMAVVPDRPDNRYVLDSAGVLSDQTEKTIIKKNEELFNQCGAEVVIVAVDFLGGQDIDDYAEELFNLWGIGSSERNNGILLVMAIAEDNYYALSGYGIEDYFNGAKFRTLLDDYLEDDFAAGRYDEGALAFFKAVVDELDSYYAGQGGVPPEDDSDDYDIGGYYEEDSFFPRLSLVSLIARVISVVVRVVIVVVILLVIFAVLRNIGRGGGGGGTRGGGGGGFWQGMFLGSMMNHRRRSYWTPPPPPPPGPRPGGFGGFGGSRSPGSFGGPRPGSGFGGSRSGGFHGGGRVGGGSSGRSGFGGHSGGFHGGGGTRGGGAGRR